MARTAHLPRLVCSSKRVHRQSFKTLNQPSVKAHASPGSRPVPATSTPRCRSGTKTRYNSAPFCGLATAACGLMPISPTLQPGQHHWRRRAEHLAVARCLPLGAEGEKARLANALGCRVAFVLPYGKQGRKTCATTTICPFWWAREVRRQRLTTDAAFFPTLPGAKNAGLEWSILITNQQSRHPLHTV
jgi:hypothetical protein